MNRIVSIMREFISVVLTAILTICVLSHASLAADTQPAEEKLPALPKEYVNDYTGLICHLCVNRDNQRLAEFDRETGNRITVAVYQKLPAGTGVEDYARRAFEQWTKADPAKRMVVIFVFVDEQKMIVHRSPELQGVITDKLIQDVVQNQILPGFEQRQAGEGLSEGLTTIMNTLRAKHPQNG